MSGNPPKLLSGRVSVTPYSDLNPDRYQFLGLSEAEPSLGSGAANSVLILQTGNTRAWSNSITLTSLAVIGNANVGNIGATNGVFTNVSGNGANLSSIAGANVTGTVANATYAVSAGSATTAGTVTTAAQPNITSVGTLSGLTSTGTVNLTDASNVSLGSNSNVKLTGGTTGQYLQTDGGDFREISDVEV